MQLGDIAMEATKKHAVDVQHAEEWYRKASAGHPPEPEALFQLARIRHEVLYDLHVILFASSLSTEHDSDYVLTRVTFVWWVMSAWSYI